MAKFTRELDELVANNIITPEAADNIRNYYDKPTSGGQSLLVIAFGIIGALLVGMGVVLIIAHNWDELSVPVKLVIGLGPMLIAQVFAAYIIFKSIQSQAWRESIAVILIFGVATAISIVSQVYNIHGDFGRFLLVWAVLTLPVMYVLKSRIASLIYWIIISWFVVDAGFAGWHTKLNQTYLYWPLALAAIPFYIKLIRRTPEANSVSFHNWIIAISLTIVLGMGEYTRNDDYVVAAYVSLFSVFLLIGQLPVFEDRKLINNAWLIGGSAGTIWMLLMLTFDWIDLPGKPSVTMMIWILLSVIAGVLLYIVGTKKGFKNILSKSYTFIVFAVLMLIGIFDHAIARGLTNVLLLALGVYTIREGALANKLWRMNYGLLIMAVLIACRFFDTDMSFVIRGLLFVAIGAGFFGMNYYMIRKRKISS